MSRRLRRILLCLLISPPILLLLGGGALYIPWIQEAAVRYATRQLSEQLAMQIHIGRLRLGFPASLTLEELLILPHPTDTLLALDRLELGLSLRPLLDREIAFPRASVEGLHFAQQDSLGLTQTRVDLPKGVLEALRIDTRERRVSLGLLQTDGGRVYYSSTDTTSTPNEPLSWRIRAEEIRLTDTELTLRLPMDSILVSSQIEHLGLLAGDLDLNTNELTLGSGSLSASNLVYAVDEMPARIPYLDPKHLALTDVSLELQDLYSLGAQLSLSIKKGAARERSGLALRQLQGFYRMDSLSMRLANLALGTEHSTIYGEIELPWSILDSTHRGTFSAILDGAIGVQDVRRITGRSLVEINEYNGGSIPSSSSALTGAIDFALHAHGSVDSLWIDRCQLLWGGVLDVSARGSLTDLLNPKGRRGSLSVEGGTQSGASSLLAVLNSDLARAYRLPEGLTIKGQLGFGLGRGVLQMRLADGASQLGLRGSYDELTKVYDLTVDARELNLARYMRQTPLGGLTAQLEVSGRGLDWRSKRTEALAKLRLNHLGYAGRSLRDITLDGSLKGGALALAVNSFNEGLNLAVQLDGLLMPDGVYSSIVLEAEELDLERWALADLPLKLRGQLTGELRTDYKQTHSLTTTLRDMHFVLSGRDIRPKEVVLEASTTPSASQLRLSSGDLLLDADVAAGPDALASLSGRLSQLGSQVLMQLTDTVPMRLRLEDVLTGLPETKLSFAMGEQNALRPYLAEQRLSIGALSANLALSPSGDLRGLVSAQNIRQDTLRISQVSLGINTIRTPRPEGQGLSSSSQGNTPNSPDSLALELTYALSRELYRSQEAYTISGYLRSSFQEARGAFAWVDMAGRLRHQLALEASWSGAYYALRFPIPTTLVAYQSLEVNPDNTLRINKKSLGIDGDLRLMGAGNVLLALKGEYDQENRQQQAELQIERLPLHDFRSLGLPDLGGTLFADVRYGRTGGWDSQPTITGDLSVQKLRYEDKELGHFATALFYEPRTDHSHYISAEMSYRGDEALSLDAIYYPDRKEEALSGTLSLLALPLEVANPFLHRYGINLGGRSSGQLSLGGTLFSPRLQGSVRGERAELELIQYATKLELDSLPLRFESEALHFDHYALRSSKDRQHPLYIDGLVTLSGPRAMTADLKLQTSGMTLLNQPRPHSERELVYGRLIASTDMTLRGRLDALKVRGRIDIQGGTNCIYVLREGGIDAAERGQELLSFVDFSDTLFVREPVAEARLGGLDAHLALHIDPSVRLGVDLTADGTDYMRMQGGGDMQFSYPPYGEMTLIGRYNMSGGGQLHYTLPVVGAKLFEISPTGYMRFGGNIYNPYIQFKATQQVKATVGSATKKTNFVVGIEVKDNIEDLKLGFDLTAPEDLSVQNTLSTMTREERGKQALGLMATGLFLAGRTGGKLKFDSALTSLLQSQINKAAGSLLRGTDINIGMETHDSSSGGVYTDYTYSVSRRFYNDRIRVVVGGKIQSGNVPSNQEQTLIDNVALEYQLDKAGEQYLRLYHKRITDNPLEGEHTETGLGYLIKRKLSRPSDLFRFRFYRPQPTQPAPHESKPWEGVPLALPADTTIHTTIKDDDR